MSTAEWRGPATAGVSSTLIRCTCYLSVATEKLTEQQGCSLISPRSGSVRSYTAGGATPLRTSRGSSNRSTPPSRAAWPSMSCWTTFPPISPRDHHVAGAQGPPSLAPALHPDLELELVDQPHRTLVQGTHRPAAATRCVHQRQRPPRRHHHLGRALERRPHALPLESHRRRHHRKGPTRPHRTDPPDQYEDGPLMRLRLGPPSAVGAGRQ